MVKAPPPLERTKDRKECTEGEKMRGQECGRLWAARSVREERLVLGCIGGSVHAYTAVCVCARVCGGVCERIVSGATVCECVVRGHGV